MNQVLQRSVYQMGNRAQAEFIADIGGMLPEERTAFLLLHDGHKERYIMDEIGVDAKAYALIESAIRAKVAVAAFYCIGFTQDHMK